MKDRILALINAYNLTSTQFADEIDSSKSKLSHIFSGRNNPSLDVVTNILENFPEVNPDWLILGKGKMFRSMENDDDNENIVVVKKESKESSDIGIKDNTSNVQNASEEELISQEQKPSVKNEVENINMKDLFAEINKLNLEFPKQSSVNTSKTEINKQNSDISTDSIANVSTDINIAKSEDKVEYKTVDRPDINTKSSARIDKIIVLKSDGTFEEYFKS